MSALKTSLLCLLAAFLAGCAGYQLGPVNGAIAGGRTIEIQPFNDQTLQPRLGDAVTQAVRERIQADATCRLATDTPADIVVSGVIRNFNQRGLGFLNRDVATPQNYRVTMTVHVVARERATGKILLDRDVKGQALINIGSDLASSERQGAPLVAADAAQNIVALLTEGAW
jgi:hypothetical protein